MFSVFHRCSRWAFVSFLFMFFSEVVFRLAVFSVILVQILVEKGVGGGSRLFGKFVTANYFSELYRWVAVTLLVRGWVSDYWLQLVPDEGL